MNSKQERFDFYRKKMLSPNGLTELDYVDSQMTMDKDYGGKFRHDIAEIKMLLKKNNVPFKEEGTPKRYYLEQDVDLNALLTENKKKSLSSRLFDFLSHIKISLPDNFLSDLQKKGSLFFEVDDLPKVSFESNEFLDLDDFPTLYSAIGKKCLLLSLHKMNNPDCKHDVLFCPEYLKQYDSLWYVFGVARSVTSGKFLNNDMKECESLCVYRVDLQLIDEIKESDWDFIPSGRDYEEFFSDIIGVDNINRNVVEVKMLVKNTMIERFMNNPIHESFNVYPNRHSEFKNYSVATMMVKHNKELVRKILSYGSDLIVLSPQSLRNELCKEYKKINIFYSM